MQSLYFFFFFLSKNTNKKAKKQKQFQREIRKQVFYHWESGRIYHRWVGFGVISVVILYGVRWHLCNSTSSSTSDITLDPHVASLSPCRAPRVLHYPIVDTSHCAISNNSNSVVCCCSTWSGEYALKIEFENQIGLHFSSIYFPYLPITCPHHSSLCLKNFKRFIARFKWSVDARLYHRYLYGYLYHNLNAD